MKRPRADALRAPSGRVLVAVAGLVLALLCLRQLAVAEDRVVTTSGVAPMSFVAPLPARGGTVCQPQDRLPRAARRVRLTVGTYGRPGPALELAYRVGNRTRAAGRLTPGWTEGVIDLRLAARDADLPPGRFCLRSAGGARLTVAGEGDAAASGAGAATAVTGRMSLVALTEDRESTLSLLPELARRLGRGSAAIIGPWTLVLIGLLVAGALALGGVAVARTPGPGDANADTAAGASPSPRRGLRARARAVPPAGRAVAGAALALGLAWALLIPPFQVADETSHTAYVQHLAETGDLPREQPGVPPYSPEENSLLGAIGFPRVIGRTTEKVLTGAEAERQLREVERSEQPTVGAGNATTASANPPLYYVMQTPVYLATSSGSLLTQVLAMRLLSVLFTATSVLLAFLFLRELLPRSPWAWTAGGLACAFQPALGFVGAGVNPDSLLFLCATGLLLAAARIVRRGITPGRAVVLGAFVLLGLLTKPLFLSLVPAAGLALLYGGYRAGRAGWRAAALGAAVFVVPMALYLALASGPLDHPYFTVAADVAGGATGTAGPGDGGQGSFGKQLSFVLQQWLPRLPFLQDFVPGAPIRDTWIAGLTGVFGWVDYGFSAQVTDIAVALFEGLLILAAVALVTRRRQLAAHLPLAVVCLTALAGLLAAVGVTDYQAFIDGGARFQQARYVLPLLALYGGLFALAAKALGPRVGRVIVPALWVLVGLHTVAAMVLTANRYYL